MRRARRVWAWLGTAILLTLVSACATNGPFSRLTRQPSPYELYADGLRAAGLDTTAVGRDWLAAGQQALRDAAPVTSPFLETGYAAPAVPTASAWRFDVARGRRLSIDVAMDAATPTRLFVDLFARQADGTHEHLASLEPGDVTLTHEVGQDATYVLRLQPELLRGGRYRVTQRTLASLAIFPVQGLTARAVQSGFGVERDAGRRRHEGLDIFAPRGTPVLAVAAGQARPDTNGLGGTVVWLHQPDAGRTFYYAHLDRWAFEEARLVVAGDVLGYVGNTGNARTTSPHLHFGVYSRGPIDPLPFVHPDDPMPVDDRLAERRGDLVRTIVSRTALREGPDAASPAIREMARGTLAHVIGAHARTYRVRLPDRVVGYVAATAVREADAPLARHTVAAGTPLREAPAATAPVVVTAERSSEVALIGRFDAFALVTTAGGASGWVAVTDASTGVARP